MNRLFLMICLGAWVAKGFDLRHDLDHTIIPRTRNTFMMRVLVHTALRRSGGCPVRPCQSNDRMISCLYLMTTDSIIVLHRSPPAPHPTPRKTKHDPRYLSFYSTFNYNIELSSQSRVARHSQTPSRAGCQEWWRPHCLLYSAFLQSPRRNRYAQDATT